eukprot:TRINITY_DN1175_c0_g1_i1.p1 TRINITY_DN1175_c0_g1~~TRINITY_DN1175_c0_g1_i1.p1  ORF type:complete len:369 (+),score=185.37 TRINITY_DN1175_c0_g1_i1:69-1175(+)
MSAAQKEMKEFVPGVRETGITDSVLDLVGNTPMVRLNRLPEMLGLECEVLAKCEFFNPGGSVKDRIARRMVLDAGETGRIKKGDTLVEPTSGNTGIGMALASAVAGYKMVVTMPMKMSKEKRSVITALGADIIRTPNEAAYDDYESHISVANRMRDADPENVHVLDQYVNTNNPDAHYYGTAEEILRQTGGKFDMIVMGAGTGGTITGTAKRLKEVLPNLIVVGVDPKGSILAEGGGKCEGPMYQVEGIGYDFIPDVLDRSIVDVWVKSTDKPSFDLARQLIAKEGLLVGGSAGSAMYGVAQEAKKLKKGQRCVVVFSDGIRNYLTKFVDDDWMKEHDLMEGEPKDLTLDAAKKRIADLEAEVAALKK